MLIHVKRLPLNPTKNLLGATTEKLKDGSPDFQIGSQIWGPAMHAILPNLLQLARLVVTSLIRGNRLIRISDTLQHFQNPRTGQIYHLSFR